MYCISQVFSIDRERGRGAGAWNAARRSTARARQRAANHRPNRSVKRAARSACCEVLCYSWSRGRLVLVFSHQTRVRSYLLPKVGVTTQTPMGTSRICAAARSSSSLFWKNLCTSSGGCVRMYSTIWARMVACPAPRVSSADGGHASPGQDLKGDEESLRQRVITGRRLHDA